jgi:DNA-binding GntR family transcriptional regulator
MAGFDLTDGETGLPGPSTGLRKAEYVYEVLKRQLISGTYEFGETLAVSNLAAHLGTSRQPVMDALKRLQTDGFVEVIPQVGCRVRVPRTSDVDDLYEIFATVEGVVTAMAADRRRPEQLPGLSQFVGRLGEAVEDGEFNNVRYAELNRAFHSRIHLCASSEEARSAAEAYWDRSDFLIASMRPQFWRTNLDHAQDEHLHIYEAVAAQDSRAARELAYEHIRHFGHAVRAHLETAGPSDTRKEAGA